MMSQVGVMSCAHGAWHRSSRVMGEALAAAAGYGAGDVRIHTPVDAEGFAACFPEAALWVIHTHGSPHHLYDQRATGKIPKIIGLAELEALPVQSHIRLVFLTACSVAGDDPNHNVASVLSTRISPRGIVIGNLYTVWGEDYDFGARDNRRGWVIYQNGRILYPHTALPPSLTMSDAYRILLGCGG